MPTGPKNQKRHDDAIGNVVAEPGRKGAAARAANLSPKKRIEIAPAASANWWAK